jgi:hypothetical protein
MNVHGAWSLVLALSTATPLVTAGQAQPTASESKLKAAFVSKFAQFVEWPAGSLDANTIDICVAPPDPFGSDLQELVSGETINGRPVTTRRVGPEDALAGCQVLFLPFRPDAHPHPLLERARSRPILTIGDDPHFLDDGGVIGLRVVNGRMRFDVDAAAARRVGLGISSQLLRLALTVREGAP